MIGIHYFNSIKRNMANLLNLFLFEIKKIKYPSILSAVIAVLLQSIYISMMGKPVLKLNVKSVMNILKFIKSIHLNLNISVLIADGLYSSGKNKSSALYTNVIMINVRCFSPISTN